MATLPKYAFFKGKIVPYSEAKVGVLNHSLNYGTGCFGGIRGYWNEEEEQLLVFRPYDHYRRFLHSTKLMWMDLGYSEEELVQTTLELVRREGFRQDCYIRPLAYKSDEMIGVKLNDLTDELSIVSFPFGRYVENEEGAHATISSWRRVEDNAIPGRAKICGAYVNSALAGDEARRNGYDEAIFLTESGHVAEGAASNIFLVRDGKLITPPVTENILEGITRACVMELARDRLFLKGEERRVDRSELYIGDELFFTGTAVEVAPITRVDHRPVGDGQIGPITRALRQLYTDATRGRLEAYRHWVAPVYHSASAVKAA